LFFPPLFFLTPLFVPLFVSSRIIDLMLNTQQSPVTIRLTSPDAGHPVEMVFRQIPACPEGFLMGSRGYDEEEEPIHRVIISEDFWMAESPVTQEQFDLWPGAAQRGKDHNPKGHSSHPANNLSWNDAVEYCGWLTATFKKQFPKGFVAAELPSESRWEYACRGGMETEYHSGDGEAALNAVGWYVSNSNQTTHAVRTAPGANAANAFGLYDMHGNVWEWCLDHWSAEAYRRRWDGISDYETFLLAEESKIKSKLNEQLRLKLTEEFRVKLESPLRVMRGGPFWYPADASRSVFRGANGSGFRDKSFGMRVCLVRQPFLIQKNISD